MSAATENVKVENVCRFMDLFAPKRLAEEWDNVGLLVGDRSRSVSRIMTCLTVTPETVEEAVEKRVDLIVTHHPIPFRPMKRITTDNTTGSLLLKLVENRVAVFSPHTRFDSAADGINQKIAEAMELKKITPLIELPDDPAGLGSGRVGKFSQATRLGDLVEKLKAFARLDMVRYVGDLESSIVKVGIACGSGGSFLNRAAFVGCQVLITGEATFHNCLEAKANNVALTLLGHFASERFALEDLAKILQDEFESLEIWPSHTERDPLNAI